MISVRQIDPGTAGEIDFLWEMLYRASWSHLEDGSTVTGLRAHADLAFYVEGWGRARWC